MKKNDSKEKISGKNNEQAFSSAKTKSARSGVVRSSSSSAQPVPSISSAIQADAQAEPVIRQTLSTRERVLGPEHPDTLASVNTLAGLLYRQGDYAGAQPLYERAIEARERVLGLEHPDTLASVNGLAGLLYRQGDYAGAQSLGERVLEGRERALGPEHPDTLASVHTLAALLEKKDDYAGAQPLYERAIEARERVLGPEHPNTLASVNGLAGLLHKKGDYAGAQSLYERAVAGLLHASFASGRQLPILQRCIKNYDSCLMKMSLSDAEIRTKLNALMQPYGMHI